MVDPKSVLHNAEDVHDDNARDNARDEASYDDSDDRDDDGDTVDYEDPVRDEGGTEISIAGEPAPWNLRHKLDDLTIMMGTAAKLRAHDLNFVQARYEQLAAKMREVRKHMVRKADMEHAANKMEQRIASGLAMQNSLRESGLQTLRNTFQAECTVLEQRLSLGSERRHVALDAKAKEIENKITVLDTGINGRIATLHQELHVKIRDMVIQGVVWGMGLVGGIIGAAWILLQMVSHGR